MKNRSLVITLGMIVIAFSSFGQQPQPAAKSPTPNVKTPVKKTPPAGSKAYNAINGLNAQTVKDIDGNVYHTVTIGKQTWMAENLKTTHYNDGIAIPLVTNETDWADLITPAYCWYNNDAVTYKNKYGALYNWFAVETGKLAPVGWHVPTDAEWIALTTYLGGEEVAGGKLKEAGTLNWLTPNTGATNSTNFSALPGGWRSWDEVGKFSPLGGTIGLWWSSSEANLLNGWLAGLLYEGNKLSRSGDFFKMDGVSVRCVKDEVPNSSSKVTGDATKGDPSKLPLTITRTGSGETLTLSFEYDTSYKLKQIKASNAKGDKETISFRYLKSKIICTHVTADQTESDTLFTKGNLIIRDKYYKYIYEKNRLVETIPFGHFMSSDKIWYNDAGNAAEMTKTFAPLTADDETVTQVATYQYDENLKNGFFFSTDWAVGSFFSLSEGEDVYRLPTSKLFGLGSTNLVKEVKNDSKNDIFQYKYLSFDEPGYPTHYEIHAISTYDNKNRLLADYKIIYTGGSLPKPEKEVITDDSKIIEQPKTIKIGTQTWSVENLNVSSFRNGDPIPEAKTVEEWQNAGNLEKPACCNYENDPENGKIYGKLYNWYAVNDPRGLAPKGMHVPSDAELTLLTSYLGGKEIAGGKLKESRTLHWKIPNISATNETGFSGLPGGSRSNSAGIGTFNHLNTHGLWWSSSSTNAKYAMSIILFGAEPKLDLNSNFKEYGFSVRCIED